ncbi:MAG: CPBP family intramembrane metalloprotease [Kurthia sp.]|nr:CPBP family intramembrane metalloprotease [Candidatus Kurthia equi]
MRNPFRRKNKPYAMQNTVNPPKKPIVQLLLAILTVVVVFFIYSLLQGIGLINKTQPTLFTMISTILIVLFFVLVYWWVNKRQRNISSVQPASPSKGIKIAVTSTVVILILQIILGNIQNLILGETDVSANQKAIEDMIQNPDTFLFIVVSTLIAAPLMEELLFRRILIGKVPPIKTKMFYFRVVLAIITFAGMHVITELVNGINLEGLFAIGTFLIISSIITFVYVRTGSIWYSMLAHFLNNSVAVIGMLT